MNGLNISSNKRKCRVEKAGSVCTRCQSLRLDCSLHSSSAVKFARPNTASGSPQHIALRKDPSAPCDGQHPSLQLQKELVALYFNEIHDTHHSIFHRPTVEQNVVNEKLPNVLLYSMMALGARFSSNNIFRAVDPRQRGEQYAARARNLLDLTDISVTTIQACILLGTVSFSKSEMQSESLYYSVAVRLALILDLPRSRCDGEIERQVNLRSSSFALPIWKANEIVIKLVLILLPEVCSLVLLIHDGSLVLHRIEPSPTARLCGRLSSADKRRDILITQGQVAVQLWYTPSRVMV